MKKSKKNDEKLESSNPKNNSSSGDSSSNTENVSLSSNNQYSNPEDASPSISDKTLNNTISEVENEEKNLENSLLKNKSLNINSNSDKKGSENNELENGIKSLNINDDDNDIDIVVDASVSNNSEKKNEIIVRDPQIDSCTLTTPPPINYELPAAPLTIPSNIEPTVPSSVDINNNNNQDQRITLNDPIMDDSIKEEILTPKDNNDNHGNISNINNDNNNNGNINGNNNNNSNNDENNNNYKVNSGSINVNNTTILSPYITPTIQNYFENNFNEQGIHYVGSVCSSDSFSYISEDQTLSVQLSNSNYNNNDDTFSNNI